MKNYLGECSLKITRPNGEHSEILVSNPVVLSETWLHMVNMLEMLRGYAQRCKPRNEVKIIDLY